MLGYAFGQPDLWGGLTEPNARIGAAWTAPGDVTARASPYHLMATWALSAFPDAS